MEVTIRRANASDGQWLQDSFDRLMGWQKPQGYFAECCRRQDNDEIALLIAVSSGKYLGHVKVIWEPDYAYFRRLSIPEIQDLNVLPDYRRKRIATRLMDVAEELIRQRSRTAGIGFGLYSDYGAAQRMYVARGYMPDGNGIAYNGVSVEPGHSVVVDDALVLYLTKALD